MSKYSIEWGDVSGGYQKEEVLFRSFRQRSMERFFTFEKGSFQARSLLQYESILRHNGAPDILRNADSIVDAACGGMTALDDMRVRYGSNRTLIGFDIINSPDVKIHINGAILKGSDLVRRSRINFIQACFSDLPDIIPDGYDALVAIPLFSATDWDSSYPLDILDKMYRGLRPGGHAQTVIEFPSHIEVQILEGLLERGISHQFTPAAMDVLNLHGLYTTDGVESLMGTLTMGPK